MFQYLECGVNLNKLEAFELGVDVVLFGLSPNTAYIVPRRPKILGLTGEQLSIYQKKCSQACDDCLVPRNVGYCTKIGFDGCRATISSFEQDLTEYMQTNDTPCLRFHALLS